MTEEKQQPWTVNPRGDRVFIKRDEAESRIGKIYVPDVAKQDRAQQGTVIAVGPGRLNEDGTRDRIDLAPGDIVMVGKYSGHDLEIAGEKYCVCREDDVIARLTPP